MVRGLAPRGQTPKITRRGGARRPVSRVLSAPPPARRLMATLDGHSSGTPVAGRLSRPTRTAARKPACRAKAARRPYLVLLPVGFTVPSPSPATRCALTAPFHPYPASRERFAGRSALCGTVPGVAPAGRYPAPCSRGARTFLPHDVAIAKAAIRPSGPGNIGAKGAGVKVGGLGIGHAAEQQCGTKGGGRGAVLE